MKFVIENHSVRMHVLDRDIRAGAGVKAGIPAAEYTPEQLEKYSKGIAIAMVTMRHSLVDGMRTDEGGTAGKPDRDPDLKVFCEHEGKRYELTAEDVKNFKAEAPKADEPPATSTKDEKPKK